MGSHFDEKAGVVELKTPFGSWSQTMEDVSCDGHLWAACRKQRWCSVCSLAACALGARTALPVARLQSLFGSICTVRRGNLRPPLLRSIRQLLLHARGSKIHASTSPKRTVQPSTAKPVLQVNVVVNLPAGTRGKDLICDIQNTHLRVQLRGAAEPLLEVRASRELALPVAVVPTSLSPHLLFLTYPPTAGPGQAARDCHCRRLCVDHWCVTARIFWLPPTIASKVPHFQLPQPPLHCTEDGQELHITLVKSDRTAANTWPSLMVTGNRFAADAIAFEAMEKKATLERFQREVGAAFSRSPRSVYIPPARCCICSYYPRKQNPGFDFSGAEISGNFHKGGPALPS